MKHIKLYNPIYYDTSKIWAFKVLPVLNMNGIHRWEILDNNLRFLIIENHETS
jgi:hypothetical protein